MAAPATKTTRPVCELPIAGFTGASDLPRELITPLQSPLHRVRAKLLRLSAYVRRALEQALGQLGRSVHVRSSSFQPNRECAVGVLPIVGDPPRVAVHPDQVSDPGCAYGRLESCLPLQEALRDQSGGHEPSLSARPGAKAQVDVAAEGEALGGFEAYLGHADRNRRDRIADSG